MIPGSASQFFLGASKAASGAGGLQVSRSLRFNASDSAYLSRVPGTAGNRKTWTWAGWVKRSRLNNGLSEQSLFACYTSGDVYTVLRFVVADTLYINQDNGGGNVWALTTAMLFRDLSAWYHIVLACDTTIASPSSDRIKLYVNGSRVTEFSSASYPSQNLDTNINRANEHHIGQIASGAFYSGYLANIHFIDGQALDPSSFTETDATTGQLIPKTYTGSYGTNGFNLLFADNSSNTASTLGKDTSGNSNNWTPNNFSVTAGNGNFAQYVYAGNATYNGSETGTSYYTGAGSQYNGFDGNTSTYVGGQNTGASWVYFRPGTAISGVSQVRVYTAYVEQIYINGSLVSLSPSAPSVTAQWYSVTSPSSTINEIAIKGRVADNSAGRFSAIEINGVVLVDNSFGSGNDSLVDSPTNYGTDTGVGGEVRGNYATFNALALNGNTLSNGNLDYLAGAANKPTLTTIAVPNTGKWYFEFTDVNSTGSFTAGVGTASASASTYLGADANGWGYQTHPSNAGYHNSGVFTTTGRINGAGSNTILGVAIDRDTQKIWFSVNGTFVNSGAPASGTNAQYSNLPTSGELFPGASTGSGQNITFNAGQRAFAYTAPSGYKALCTQNLPAPLVTKSNTVMDVALWTGNGSTQSITGLAFSPDLVWIKARSTSSYNHFLFDVIRGVNKELNSNTTDSEYTRPAPGSLTAFNSDGFTLNTAVGVNDSGTTYVGWTWDGGTSTVSNTQGSITGGAQVRANPTAGFSVVTYTGTGSAATVGHGLGVSPSFVIVKSRSNTTDWQGYHIALGQNYSIQLHSTSAAINVSNYWNGGVSSTIFGINGPYDGINFNGYTYVAYCFAPVVGYSNFGSYTGNGSTGADGPFVYTGFRPKWIMIKCSSSSQGGNASWRIFDAVRNPYNIVAEQLQADFSDAAASGSNEFDFTSNGVKIRYNSSGYNASGATYIYAAFAEAPFNYSRAR